MVEACVLLNNCDVKTHTHTHTHTHRGPKQQQQQQPATSKWSGCVSVQTPQLKGWYNSWCYSTSPQSERNIQNSLHSLLHVTVLDVDSQEVTAQCARHLSICTIWLWPSSASVVTQQEWEGKIQSSEKYTKAYCKFQPHLQFQQLYHGVGLL